MRLTLITPATVELLNVYDAAAHMNVTTRDDDLLIAGFIRTAVGKLDGPRGYLGRSLAPAQYRMSLATFTDEIALPLPPCVSVDRVDYVDELGMPRTLDTDAYAVSGLGDDDGATITRAPSHSWPATAGGVDAVRITFTAGYEDLPDALRSAILMHVAHLYENREASLVAVSAQKTPMGYDDLVEPYCVWGCG